MATTKKKGSSAKKAKPKTSTKPKTKAKPKAAPKKKTTAAKKKTVSAKKTTKKVEKKKNLKLMKIIWGIALIIVVVLAGFLLMDIFSNKNNAVAPTTQETKGPALLIIDDESCITCQSDFFATQVKENIYPDLEISKADSTSEDSRDILEELDLKYLPVYLFSTEIEEHEDWDVRLSSAFTKVNVGSEEVYLLRSEYAPGRILIDEIPITENAIVFGNEDAKVTIYEFSDFECPVCAIVHGNEDRIEDIRKQDPNFDAPVEKIFEEYVDTGKVRFVFYNFPLENIHAKARMAHNAALCAHELDGFREYSSELFKQQDRWTLAADTKEELNEIASELNLDISTCLDENRYDNQVTNEVNLGFETGVLGTPTFYINKLHLSGPLDYDIMKVLIEQTLAASE